MTREEIYHKTCKSCFLYNKKSCKPNGVVPFDATTCKTYHTEESFNEFSKLCKHLGIVNKLE